MGIEQIIFCAEDAGQHVKRRSMYAFLKTAAWGATDFHPVCVVYGNDGVCR
jgi:hypothetical protein